jgi:hypothetical protein
MHLKLKGVSPAGFRYSRFSECFSDFISDSKIPLIRNAFILFIIGILISLSSCRKDFEFEPSTGDLRFSRDTVYLDTVFTNVGSSTYTLKVYNRSDNDIEIPTIKLGKGLESKYRMTVDGMTGENGKVFNNIELLAKDSLYIFIETTAGIADANPTDFLYTDQIQFDGGSNLQTVELVTLIQDAIFLYPQRFDDGTTETLPVGEDEIYGFILDHADPNHGDEYHFTNEKPYVIYGYAAVPNGETLVIDPGARVHFHEASGILIGTGGAIQVGGDNPNPTEATEVIFEGDRLEPDFSNVQGQWGAIWLSSGSAASSFNHATIKNAVIGLYVQNNAGNLSLKNTQIYDCSIYGIYAQTGTITGENVVINTAGKYALGCTLGGSYEFTHSTFNNNWPSSSQFAVAIDNYANDADTGAQVPFDLVKAEFNNCIIYSSNSRALSVNKADSANLFNFEFHNCLLKFNTPGFEAEPEYQFTDNVHYFAMVLNENPKFLDINKNKLNISNEEDDRGGAYQNGDDAFIVPTDILGVTRTSPPDIGAYQSAPFPP